jgi:hypothetical protein
MKVIPKQANIVLLANNHNPSVVTKEWLAQNKILPEPSIDFLHTPFLSRVETEKFFIQVDRQRLDAQVKTFNGDTLSGLSVVVANYVQSRPEVVYTAAGFNSKWQVQDMSLSGKLKQIFTSTSPSFTNIFGERHDVGGIVVWEYDVFRVQMTANPTGSNAGIEFNYHLDMKTINELCEKLPQFACVTKNANQIVTELLGGDNLGHESSTE